MKYFYLPLLFCLALGYTEIISDYKKSESRVLVLKNQSDTRRSPASEEDKKLSFWKSVKQKFSK
jgi:hypothetical protein